MKRILGLDLGSKSCGIAISDPLKLTAQGLENFTFNLLYFDPLIKKLEALTHEYEIELIILGRPTYPSGDPSQTTRMVEEFRELLEKTIDVEVKYVDENYTTKKAHEVMIHAGLSRKKRKKYKDQLAAQLILQDYLNTL